MTDHSKDTRTRTELLAEIERLQFRLQEAQETLEAIRSADVDALVVAGPQGEQVFSITGAEPIYRVIVETMNEAALTVDPDGTILFCNQRFCDLMKTSIQAVMGRKVTAFVARPQQLPLKTFLAEAQAGPVQRRLTLRASDGSTVPAQLAASPLQAGDSTSICLITSDLTELEASAQSIRVLREQQQALEESEARFRTMFEANRDAIVITDDEGVLVQANPAVATIFGLPAEQILGHRLSDFLDDTLDFPAFWRAFLTSGNLRNELGVIDAEGRRREADFDAVTNILPGRHMVVVRDITARKQVQRALEEMNEQLQIQTEKLRVQSGELRVRTEELEAANHALQQSERHYRELVQNANSAIIRWNRDGTVTFFNEYAQAFFGYRQEEVLGRHVDFLLPERDSAGADLTDLAHDIAEHPERYTIHINENVCRDGRRVWMNWTNKPIFDEDGQVAEILAVGADITERKQAEEALRKSEERFRALVTASSEVLYRMSPDWSEMRQLHSRGFLADTERPNHTWREEYIPPDDQPHVTAAIQEAIRTKSIFELEHRVRRADGSLGWTFSRAVPLLDANGEIVEWFGTAGDITDRKQAEEALRRSEEQFHRLFEDDLTGDFISTPDGRILLCNPAFAKIFGFPSAPDAVGTSILDLYADTREREPLLAKLRHEGKIERLEVWRQRRDGNKIYIVENLVGAFNARGELEEIRGYLFDDTERKRAEESLRQSEERLKRTQEIAHLGSWELDLVTDHLSWSDEVYRIFGLALQEFQATYEAFLEAVHPDDRAAVDAAYSGSVREGRDTYEIEHRIVRRSTGEIRIVHEKCEHVRDASGRIIRSVGMVHDITERKHADEALRLSEERFRTLHALSPIAIVLNRLDTGQFLESNQALWEMTGYTEEEFRSLSYWDITPIDYREMEAKQLELLRTVGRYGPYEKEYIRKDGTRFPVLLSGVRTQDSSGTDLIYSVIQDITEIKEKEKALRELNTTLENKVAQRTAELQHRARQLQKLTLELSETEDRERRQLAEILHDDLQQQLAAAKFHLSLLNHRAKHDPAQQAIVGQVDEILMEAIQKSRSLSHELSPAVLYHGDFGGALIWLAGQVRTKHGLDVKVDTFGPVNIESEALKSFLYKAAQEMLFNVVKHARIDKARIRVRRFRRCICLSVSDRGRGFDPQEVRQAAGFGLLSIRERVELLGGRMKMRGVKGHGSTFHVVVPDGPVLEDGYPSLQDRSHAHDGTAVPGTRAAPPCVRVLLADDHEIVREGLISLLSDMRDIEVVGEAANGREAVNQAYRLQPDVVVMDVAMPLINGDDATRQIKLHLPQTRVIALSMYEEPDMVEKMRRAGAEAYILKTAPSEELVAAIRGRKPQPVTV